MIPGSDLLDQALSVIASSTVQYFRATGRSLNNIGQYVTVYADPVDLLGSFQPVAKSLYQNLGLDFQKSYFNFFTSNNVIDLNRDISADQLSFNNVRYQVESATPWYAIDGWVEVRCVGIATS